jgi:hypothetical protein
VPARTTTAVISALSGDQLEIAIERPEGPWDLGWKVALTTTSLTATVWTNSGEDGQSLVRFFEELARSWKGWEGERELWATHDFLLAATHDGAGHVTLWVQLGLQTSPPSKQWFASAPISLEAGELDGIARTARLLLDE